MGIKNIPEPLWHKTILVKGRKDFQRWLENPEVHECPPMFVLNSTTNGKEETLLTREEIQRLIDSGFVQIRIGLNCVIY